MKRPRLFRILIFALLVLLAASAAAMMDSIRFDPDPSHDVDFISRAERKSAPGMGVSASALGAGESRRSFGGDLARYGIQPLWISIENETDEPLVFVQIATDPDYYSPYEVSYRFHGAFFFCGESSTRQILP